MQARYDHLADLGPERLARVQAIARTLETLGGYRRFYCGSSSDAVTDAVAILEAEEAAVIDLRDRAVIDLRDLTANHQLTDT